MGNTVRRKAASEYVLIKASYPRSGTTWISQLLGHHYDLGGASVYDRAAKRSTKTKQYHSLSWVRSPLEGRHHLVISTHNEAVPSGARGLPAILVVRDVRDAVVSFAHYTVNFWRSRHPIPVLLRRYATSSRWSRLAEVWLSRGAVVLKYEDLKLNPFEALRAAMEQVLPHLEPVTDAPLPIPFEVAHKRTPSFFRRGIAGAWKDEMPPAIQKICWERHHAMMKKLGYTQ